MPSKKVFTADEIDRIERELGITLPSRCRETLLTFPIEPDEYADIHLWQFIDDVLAPNLATWFADMEEDRVHDLALEKKREAEEQERQCRRA